MPKKFDGKWYRRSWAEAEKAPAVKVAEQHRAQGDLARVIKETLNGLPSWAVFYRPTTFPRGGAKTSAEWNRDCAAMAKDDARMSGKSKIKWMTPKPKELKIKDLKVRIPKTRMPSQHIPRTPAIKVPKDTVVKRVARAGAVAMKRLESANEAVHEVAGGLVQGHQQGSANIRKVMGMRLF